MSGKPKCPEERAAFGRRRGESPATDRQQRPTAASEHLGLLWKKGFGVVRMKAVSSSHCRFQSYCFAPISRIRLLLKAAPSVQRLLRLLNGSLSDK